MPVAEAKATHILVPHHVQDGFVTLGDHSALRGHTVQIRARGNRLCCSQSAKADAGAKFRDQQFAVIIKI